VTVLSRVIVFHCGENRHVQIHQKEKGFGRMPPEKRASAKVTEFYKFLYISDDFLICFQLWSPCVLASLSSRRAEEAELPT